jgi:hypothetical protein
MVSKSYRYSTLDCDALQSCRRILTFRKKLLSPWSGLQDDNTQPWKWRQVFPKPRCLSARLYNVTNQKARAHVITALKTSRDFRHDVGLARLNFKHSRGQLFHFSMQTFSVIYAHRTGMSVSVTAEEDQLPAAQAIVRSLWKSIRKEAATGFKHRLYWSGLKCYHRRVVSLRWCTQKPALLLPFPKRVIPFFQIL